MSPPHGAGPMRLDRPFHHCGECGHGFCSRDRVLRLQGSSADKDIDCMGSARVHAGVSLSSLMDLYRLSALV